MRGFRFFVIRLALLCAFVFESCAVKADTPINVLESLSKPEGAVVKIVTPHSVSNGMPVAIATLYSTGSIESIFSFYRQHWVIGKDDTQPGFVESELPGWRLISRMRSGFNTLIQIDTGRQNGTTGFISVMAVNRSAKKEDHGVFDDLNLLSSNRSVDGNDISIMRVYASSSSVSQAYHSYRQRLIEKRWQLLSDSDVDDARVMIFTRAQSRLEVSILQSSEFGSLLVAHQVVSE